MHQDQEKHKDIPPACQLQADWVGDVILKQNMYPQR